MPMPNVPPAAAAAAGDGASAAGVDAPASSPRAWLQMLAPLPAADLPGSGGGSGGSGGSGATAAKQQQQPAAPALVPPQHVSVVWEPVERGGKAQRAPSYDACFQGF